MRTIIDPVGCGDTVIDIVETSHALNNWSTKILVEYGILSKEEMMELRIDIDNAAKIIKKLNELCKENAVIIDYLENELESTEIAWRRGKDKES